MKFDFKLPKKVKAIWVKALKSGKYKQGRAALHDTMNDTYCCLGVAQECGLAVSSDNIFVDDFLPMEIQEFLAAINDGNGVTKNGTKRKNKWHFNKIANWIDKNL